MTVTIRGREYEVEHIVKPGLSEDDEAKDYYVISGKRGSKYYTIRNHNNPHLMFCITDGFGTQHALSRVWLSDKDGTLREVNVA